MQILPVDVAENIHLIEGQNALQVNPKIINPAGVTATPNPVMQQATPIISEFPPQMLQIVSDPSFAC